MSVTVPHQRAEQARAQMLELFPEGFEELELEDGLELAAYTNAGGEERLWRAFGGVAATDVAGGWEERWRQFHRGARVGRVWVGPPWEPPDGAAVSVTLDPGRAFGTGSHPTTRLCLALLQLLSPGSLLDVGCGSGVLSIAAARLGFAPVIAVDHDPLAVEATSENARRNGVSVDVRLANVLVGELPATDVAVANISLEAVSELGGQLRARRVVTSGYLASERPALPGFARVQRREADGWAADCFERTSV